jgi:hypothetical protein
MRPLKISKKRGAGALLLVFENLEVLIILCFGTVLLGIAFFELGKRISQTGSKLQLAVFIAFWAISASSILRDIVNRRLGNISKFFLTCWGVCVLIAGWIWMR